MNRKRRRIVDQYRRMKPYQGTRLERELEDAKNRARAHRRRDN